MAAHSSSASICSCTSLSALVSLFVATTNTYPRHAALFRAKVETQITHCRRSIHKIKRSHTTQGKEMTSKERVARELSDVQYRDLAEFARKIRRAVESPLKPLVHRVVPVDGEQRDTSHRTS